MTQDTGAGKNRETAADVAAVRAWFDEHGWNLQPQDLRHALRERGAGDQLIIDLIDEGADRRRAAERNKPAAGQPAPAKTDGAVPPQNLEAEESVLGAAMISQAAIGACRRIVDAGDFYRESHAKIWRAILALDDREDPVDAITLTDELQQRGELDHVGGRVRLHELAALVPATANASHYATIVHETATLRGLIRAAGEIARLGWERPGDTLDLVERGRELYDQVLKHATEGRARISILAADAFLKTKTDTVGVLLGTADDKVLPEHGFGLVYGKGAAGKTTLVTTMVAALASATPWLGIPVARPVRVLMIENEGPKAPYIEKIERFADQWTGGDFLHNVHFYEEPWGRFNLADRGMRDDLLAFTREQHIDLVVAGPLRGLGMDGPGAPSETDAFLNLLKEAGLGTELAWQIVHHTNKAGQISGDWDRQPDLLIRYTYTGKRRNELLWEKIRWGDQGRAPLVLEWLDEGVGYRILDTTVPDVDWDEIEAKVLDAIAANPGASQRKVEEVAGGKSTHVRQTISRLVERGLVENRGTGNRKAFHTADGQRQTTLDGRLEPVADPRDDEPEEMEWR